MRIEHIALWTTDLDRCRAFYVTYFGARSGATYRNDAKRFASVFLCFEGGARLEIMTRASLAPPPPPMDTRAEHSGIAHLAIAVGSERRVDELTDRLRQDGFTIVDGPRRTGDGYYESVVLDPDGNRVEVTA